MVFRIRKKTPPTPLRLFRPFAAFPAPGAKLHRLARILYKGEKITLSRTVSLVLCSDRAIRRLNARYRSTDRVTDVLSFTMDDPDLLGEIYISLQRADAQARHYKTTYTDELCRLFIHGFFHLLGFDHETTADRAAMESKERRYLRRCRQ